MKKLILYIFATLLSYVDLLVFQNPALYSTNHSGPQVQGVWPKGVNKELTRVIWQCTFSF